MIWFATSETTCLYAPMECAILRNISLYTSFRSLERPLGPRGGLMPHRIVLNRSWMSFTSLPLAWKTSASDALIVSLFFDPIQFSSSHISNRLDARTTDVILLAVSLATRTTCWKICEYSMNMNVKMWFLKWHSHSELIEHILGWKKTRYYFWNRP